MTALAKIAVFVTLASMHAAGQMKVTSILTLGQLQTALKEGNNLKIGNVLLEGSVKLASEVSVPRGRTLVVLGGRSRGPNLEYWSRSTIYQALVNPKM